MSTPDTSPQALRVWDPVVRVVHWGLVACVLANHLLEEGGDAHRWVGYAASALVALRVLWGFVGTRHARFSDALPTPSRLRAHVADLLAGRHRPVPGHNPLGALMMLALLLTVAGLGLTGWMQGLDAFWGDEWLEELHEGLANALLALAGVHALAAIVMGRLERVNLVRAMLTGVKRFR
jgi:cytochrome b